MSKIVELMLDLKNVKEVLCYKIPNCACNFNYQYFNGSTIKCGCFKTYDAMLWFFMDEGFTKIDFNGKKWIILKRG